MRKIEITFKISDLPEWIWDGDKVQQDLKVTDLAVYRVLDHLDKGKGTPYNGVSFTVRVVEEAFEG